MLSGLANIDTSKNKTSIFSKAESHLQENQIEEALITDSISEYQEENRPWGNQNTLLKMLSDFNHRSVPKKVTFSTVSKLRESIPFNQQIVSSQHNVPDYTNNHFGGRKSTYFMPHTPQIESNQNEETTPLAHVEH